MHLYAYIDENNLVVDIVTGKNTPSNYDWERHYSDLRCCVCKRGSEDGSYRKNKPGVGFTWDSGRDAFIPPKPFASWILNEGTCQWEAPVAHPDPANPVSYTWDEVNQQWNARA